MEITPYLFNALVILAIGGLVKWIWSIQRSLDETRLNLAQNYHGKEELRQVVCDAVQPLTREIERLARVVERLRGEDK